MREYVKTTAFLEAVRKPYVDLLKRGISETKEGKKDTISLIDMLTELSEIDKLGDDGEAYIDIANAIGERAFAYETVETMSYNLAGKGVVIRKVIANIVGTDLYYQDDIDHVQDLYKSRLLAIKNAKWIDKDGEIVSEKID